MLESLEVKKQKKTKTFTNKRTNNKEKIYLSKPDIKVNIIFRFYVKAKP